MIDLPGTSTVEVHCEKCKHVYEAEIIDHVDLSEDRELIKNLKSGKANRVQCPKCKKVMYLDRSIVINFEPQNLIVVYDPKATTKAKREELMQSFESVKNFSETLHETAEEVEFLILNELEKLKELLNNYVKTYM